MTEQTRITPDGELTIPREQIEQEGWTPETELEVVHTGGGILVRPKQVAREEISWDEFDRRRPLYRGPPLSLQEMERIVLDEAGRRYRDKSRQP